MMNHVVFQLASLALLALSLPLHAATVTVFAAASLTDSLKEVADAYEKTSNDKIIFNFAGSGILARQIQEGASADIFFSADKAKMDALMAQGLIATNTRVDLLGNLLVAVIPSDSILHIMNANNLVSSSVKRVAIGEPEIVPAGAYAKSYFETLKLWETIKLKVVPCENVRAVVAAVESGNVDAGMVYKTDAVISKKVKVAFEVPLAEGSKITYAVAVVKDSKERAAAAKFLVWLKSETAAGVFCQAGFLMLSQTSSAQ